jgi:PHD/YefM family antitoxin component YafN of YafNO toxin-antitoxin module
MRSMTTVSATKVRVDQEVRSAIERHDPVRVVKHGQATAFVILHPADFELVSALLDRRRHGRPIPFHSLLNDDDLAVMAEDRQTDGDALAAGIWESWHA